MKRALSSLLVFALVLTLLVPAFAFAADKTTEEKFNELKEKGLLNGVEDGSAALDRELTRAELAAILVRLFKLEPITGQSSFIDVPAEHWAQKEGVIEAVAKAGLMGSTTTYSKTFSPDAKLTIAEVAKVAVSALKLTVDENAKIDGVQPWAAPYVDAALKAGLIAEAKDYHANANRGILVDAAYVIYTTVINPVTGATKVESVKADNLAQVTVTFDGTVDKESAEDVNNYSIDGFEFDSATLSEDAKSVVLTLAEDAEGFKNQKTYKLTVDNVKNTEGKYVAKADNVEFTPVDVTIPKVAEVKALGTKALQITFTEPVKKATANTTASYKIDGKSIAGSVKYLYPDSVIILTTMTTGDHTVTVSGVKDYADFLVSGEVAFNVAVDTEAPQIVEGKANDLKQVTLTFNEPIKSLSKVYHTSTGKTGSPTIKGDKVVIDFSTNPLSLGENVVYAIAVEDYSGNKADRQVVVNPVLDTEKPTVTKVEVKYNSTSQKYTFNIYFSEALNEASARTKSNYTLKDSNGNAVVGSGFDSKGHPATTISYSSSNYVVSFDTANNSLKPGKYTLEVAGVVDNAFVGNTMLPSTHEVTIGDVSTLHISSAWVVESKVSGKNEYDSVVYITFNKNLATEGAGNAEDASKYLIAYDKTSTGDYNFNPVPGTSASLISPDTVMLTLPRSTKSFFDASGDIKDTAVKVLLVADTAGNFLNDPVYSEYKKLDKVGYVTIGDVVATSPNTIDVTFNGVLSNINAGDFYLTDSSNNEYGLTLENTVNKSGKTVATFNLVSLKLNASATGYKFNVVDQDEVASQNLFDFKVQSVKNKTILDGITPSLDVIKIGDTEYPFTLSYNTIDSVYELNVAFDESIKVNNVNTNLISVKVNSTEVKVDTYKAVSGKLVIVLEAHANGGLVKASDGSSQVPLGDYDTIAVTVKAGNTDALSITDESDNPVIDVDLSNLYKDVAK